MKQNFDMQFLRRLLKLILTSIICTQIAMKLNLKQKKRVNFEHLIPIFNSHFNHSDVFSVCIRTVCCRSCKYLEVANIQVKIRQKKMRTISELFKFYYLCTKFCNISGNLVS